MSAAGSPWQQQMHTLYDEHHGWLFGWLRRKLGSSENAADLAQDTFVRIIASRDALLGVREPRAFLVTTAQRLIIDQAIQLHGAAGLSQWFPLAELYADVRHLRFADGPDEVHHMVVGRHELSLHLVANN